MIFQKKIARTRIQIKSINEIKVFEMDSQKHLNNLQKMKTT